MIKFCCWTVFNLLLPLLICHMHGVGNFRKSLYRSHVSDPIYHPMKMVIMNYESVTNLFLKIPCHDIIYCLPLYTRIGRMQWREQANSDFFFCWWLNATFSNMWAISWWLVLVLEEARVPGENHRPWASNWVTLSLAAVIYKASGKPMPYWW